MGKVGHCLIPILSLEITDFLAAKTGRSVGGEKNPQNIQCLVVEKKLHGNSNKKW